MKCYHVFLGKKKAAISTGVYRFWLSFLDFEILRLRTRAHDWRLRSLTRTNAIYQHK